MKKNLKMKVSVSGKKRLFGMFAPVVLMIICVIALLLSIYSFISGNVAFGVCYIIAIVLGIGYIVIKFNQFFATYLATDEKNIILKCWENHFFPYNAWNGIPFIRDFIPARTNIAKVPMNEIDVLMIGTKSYIKRMADDETFNKEIASFEKHKYSGMTGMFNKANIIYIRTNSGESCFMSLTGFEPKNVMNIVNQIAKKYAVDVRINSKVYKRYLKNSVEKITESDENKTDNTDINDTEQD